MLLYLYVSGLCRHKFKASQELLSHASNVLGQSLLQTANGKNVTRRNAFACFVNAAKLVHTFPNIVSAVYHRLLYSCIIHVYTIFYPDSKLTILTLHLMTYHLLVVLFNYTLYCASELWMGAP